MRPRRGRDAALEAGGAPVNLGGIHDCLSCVCVLCSFSREWHLGTLTEDIQDMYCETPPPEVSCLWCLVYQSSFSTDCGIVALRKEPESKMAVVPLKTTRDQAIHDTRRGWFLWSSSTHAERFRGHTNKPRVAQRQHAALGHEARGRSHRAGCQSS